MVLRRIDGRGRIFEEIWRKMGEEESEFGW
jgi:hypothetical protein